MSSGEVRRVGPPRLYSAFAPSPDGRFLIVAWLERPFSYTVPCGRFPKRIQVWDRCAPLPLALNAGVGGQSSAARGSCQLLAGLGSTNRRALHQ